LYGNDSDLLQTPILDMLSIIQFDLYDSNKKQGIGG
jgi:hypothetical protein